MAGFAKPPTIASETAAPGKGVPRIRANKKKLKGDELLLNKIRQAREAIARNKVPGGTYAKPAIPKKKGDVFYLPRAIDDIKKRKAAIAKVAK